MVLLLERKSRTLQRLLASPMRPYEVIAGQVLAMFMVVFFQQLILVLIGQLGILLAEAASFFGLAIWRFRFE
jgi:ABC-type Na+ efflux pump permease subunit